jgi:hypothetical protein
MEAGKGFRRKLMVSVSRRNVVVSRLELFVANGVEAKPDAA